MSIYIANSYIMKRNYIRPQVHTVTYSPMHTLCASGNQHQSFGTGGTANPGGGR